MSGYWLKKFSETPHGGAGKTPPGAGDPLSKEPFTIKFILHPENYRPSGKANISRSNELQIVSRFR